MDFDYHWDGKLLSLLSGYEIVSKDLHQSYRSHQHYSIAERHTIHLQMIINSKTDCTNISHIRTHILFQICQNLCLRIMKLLILLYHFCLCGILLIFPSDAAQSAHTYIYTDKHRHICIQLTVKRQHYCAEFSVAFY